MKNLTKLLTLSLVMFALCSYTYSQNLSQDNQSSTELEIQPQLGHPFGTVVEIEAEVIDGQSTRTKQWQGQYLLRVIK